MPETYTGAVKRVIYNKDGFSIFAFKSARDFVALGNVPDVKEDDQLTISGAWVEHPRFGLQFKVERWEKHIETTEEKIAEVLSSGAIKGVGPATAKKIVDALGSNALKIILEDPEALGKVKGIGKRADKIRNQILEKYDTQYVVSELVKMGLTVNTAIKAHKKFGRAAVEFVKENPYILTELDLIGFLKADEIAQRMGVKKPYRIQAGILYVLTEALWSEGHTYLPEEELVGRALELLNKKSGSTTSDDVKRELNFLVRTGKVTGDVALSFVRRCEKEVAFHVRRLSRRFGVNPTPFIAAYEKIAGLSLTPEQIQAARMALTSGLSILTGGPGVGKTSTVKAIIGAFKMMYPGEGVYLAAPTGRASRRMSEATGHEAQTIHKMLGLNEKEEAVFNSGNPLPCSLLIVDETSMADVFVARHLLSAVKDGARVLFVGDADQLPSVGPGNVLKDLMGSVPCVKLYRIFRQAAESSIVVNAHRINSGQMPIFDRTKKDLVFLERETPEEIIECVKTCLKNLPYGPMDVQVIAPMRKGPVGTEEINRAVQGMFSAKELRHNSKAFKEGDKVIHTKNNYAKDVLNGDVGVVEKICGDGLTVRYNGHVVSYSREDLKELEPGWAISIHKSQGSEYKAVIIVLSTSHYVMLARNLIYTAITRAKELAVIIGSRKALAIAVRNNKPTERHTMLRKFLSPA